MMKRWLLAVWLGVAWVGAGCGDGPPRTGSRPEPGHGAVVQPAGSLDGPRQPYSDAAVSEGGWLLLSGLARTSTGPAPTSSKKNDVGMDAACAGRTLARTTQNFALDARPCIEATKYGRKTSLSTTIPPPAV